MSIKYQGRFGKKTRRAVDDFVKRLCQSTSAGEVALVAPGPSGEVLLLFETKGAGARQEETLREQMSRISSDVFDKHSVWIIGVPKKPGKIAIR